MCGCNVKKTNTQDALRQRNTGKGVEGGGGDGKVSGDMAREEGGQT